MFRGETAWFSSSVRKENVDFWLLEGGTVADWRKADYLFSEDASCPDIQSIFESEDFLLNEVTVFHSLFLSTCEKRQSMKSVCISHYVLPPAAVQAEVRNVVGRLIWEYDDDGEQFEAENPERSLSVSTEDECSEEDISRLESEFSSEEDVPLCDYSQNHPGGSASMFIVNMENLRKYSGHLCDFHFRCYRCSRCQVLCYSVNHT